MPDDVVWHFIGHLQSNKAKALVAGVPNLAVLETLDTVKLANKLQVRRNYGGVTSDETVGLVVDCNVFAPGAKVAYDARSDAFVVTRVSILALKRGCSYFLVPVHC